MPVLKNKKVILIDFGYAFCTVVTE